MMISSMMAEYCSPISKKSEWRPLMATKQGRSKLVAKESSFIARAVPIGGPSVSHMINGRQTKTITITRVKIHKMPHKLASVFSRKYNLKTRATVQVHASHTIEMLVAKRPISELRMLSSARTVVITGNEVIEFRATIVLRQTVMLRGRS